jgi:hypothetical protein
MSNAIPTYYTDAAAITARSAEVPNADFTTGVNTAASNACGIGINIGGGEVVGTPAQFTLLDQAEAARTPQTSQILGEDTAAIKAGAPSISGDGSVPVASDATLATLQAGWLATP